MSDAAFAKGTRVRLRVPNQTPPPGWRCLTAAEAKAAGFPTVTAGAMATVVARPAGYPPGIYVVFDCDQTGTPIWYDCAAAVGCLEVIDV